MSDDDDLQNICSQAVAEIKALLDRTSFEDPEAPPGKMRAEFYESVMRQFRADARDVIERAIAETEERCGPVTAKWMRENLERTLAELAGNRLQ